MKPVAWKWEDRTGAEWLCGDRDDAQQVAAIVGAVAEPLVRLSDAEASIAELEARLTSVSVMKDEFQAAFCRVTRELEAAEARIKELEAELAEADALIKAQQHDFAQNNIRNAENAHRAEAAEALLKEAGDIINRAQQNTPKHFSNWHEAARTLLAKIGGRDA